MLICGRRFPSLTAEEWASKNNSVAKHSVYYNLLRDKMATIQNSRVKSINYKIQQNTGNADLIFCSCFMVLSLKYKNFGQTFMIIFKMCHAVIYHFASSLGDPSWLCTHEDMREWIPNKYYDRETNHCERLADSWSAMNYRSLESCRRLKKRLTVWLKEQML